MLKMFDEKLDMQEPTPKILLKALQKEMLGTLTGYVSKPFMDPVSILTKGRVQLSRYRDFGNKGVSKKNCDLQELLTATGKRNVCAIVNVDGHEFRGRKDSHYVLVTGLDKNKYTIQDPGSRKIKYLFTPQRNRFYQVSLYQAMNIGASES